jgi:hypothetical protein
MKFGRHCGWFLVKVRRLECLGWANNRTACGNDRDPEGRDPRSGRGARSPGVCRGIERDPACSRGPPSCVDERWGIRRRAVIWRSGAFRFPCSARMAPSHRPFRYHCSADRFQVHAFRVCLLVHAPVPSLPPRSLVQRMERSRRPQCEELGISVKWVDGSGARSLAPFSSTAQDRQNAQSRRDAALKVSSLAPCRPYWRTSARLRFHS